MFKYLNSISRSSIYMLIPDDTKMFNSHNVVSTYNCGLKLIDLKSGLVIRHVKPDIKYENLPSGYVSNYKVSHKTGNLQLKMYEFADSLIFTESIDRLLGNRYLILENPMGSMAVFYNEYSFVLDNIIINLDNSSYDIKFISGNNKYGLFCNDEVLYSSSSVFNVRIYSYYFDYDTYSLVLYFCISCVSSGDYLVSDFIECHVNNDGMSFMNLGTNFKLLVGKISAKSRINSLETYILKRKLLE